jgi:carbonic anhydrase
MKPARIAAPLLLMATSALCVAAAWASEPAAAHGPKPGPATAKAAKASAAAHAAAPAAEGARVATAPAAAPADPMEQLRQRLADRLSQGGKPADNTNPYEVRLTVKPGPAMAPAAAHGAAHAPPQAPAPAGVQSPSAAHPPAAAAPRTTAHRAATGKTVSTKGADAHGGAHGGAAHWGYDGPAGPQTWGGLKPEFALCANGQRQSPIDIRGGLSVDLEPVKFDYQSTRFGVVDNGHTVQVNVAVGNNIEINGKRFELKQFHFHRPSEERIDGRQFEMSVHLVHKDEQGKLAVVAVLLDKGQLQPAVQKVWNNLPLEKNEEAQARISLDINEILPVDRRYFTYMGSLTTPPCSEGVHWVVMRQPVTMTAEQIELFARIYPMNARPVQQASGRRIMQSN